MIDRTEALMRQNVHPGMTGAKGTLSLVANAIPLLILWTASVAGGMLGFAAQAIFARAWTIEEYGALASAFAVSVVVAPLAAFGTGPFLVQRWGIEGAGPSRWLRPALSFVGGSTLVVLLGLQLWSAFGGDLLSTRLVKWLSPVVALIAASEILQANLQMAGRYSQVAFVSLLPNLLRFACALATSSLAWGIIDAARFLFLGYWLTAAAISIYLLVELRRSESPNLKVPVDRKSIGAVAAGSWPFGVGGAAFLVAQQASIILLSLLENEAAAGRYSAAIVLTTAVMTVPHVTFHRFLLPKLHRLANDDKGKFDRTIRMVTGWVSLAGLAAGAGTWILGPTVVSWIFGREYLDLWTIRVIAVGIPIRFAAASIAAAFTSPNEVRAKARIFAIAAAATIALGIILIPPFGAVGAGLAVALADLLQVRLLLRSRRVHRSQEPRG